METYKILANLENIFYKIISPCKKFRKLVYVLKEIKSGTLVFSLKTSWKNLKSKIYKVWISIFHKIELQMLKDFYSFKNNSN